MYYIRLNEDEGNTLVYYCRNCGHEDDILTKEYICVSNTQLKRTEQKYSHIINKYTKLDPTLPRTTAIKCPNNDCVSNKNNSDENYKQNEVIYIRYDDMNMKFIYICVNCDTMWKTDEQK
jgi:DNA-directed RNA polymerase subunit M/transcription elongation factor TFIIS